MPKKLTAHEVVELIETGRGDGAVDRMEALFERHNLDPIETMIAGRMMLDQPSGLMLILSPPICYMAGLASGLIIVEAGNAQEA